MVIFPRVVSEGRALNRAVVEADLEGIVAKRPAGAHRPKLTRWVQILNRRLQRRGRAEWFRERRGF
jgi:ATP-dependent DNA ligase